MAENGENITVRGTVKKITYRNSDNGYTVFILDTDDGDLTVVGTAPYMTQDDFINCTGSMVYHPNYGEQLKAETIERVIKKNRASIVKYLSSGSIKGVGPVSAKLIVERFGDKTLEIIENEPERLAEIRGISYSKAQSIHEEYIKQFGMQDVIIFLGNLGISADEALKIFKKLGPDTNDAVSQNPYILCTQGLDFGFDRAEEIAAALNFNFKSPQRIKAGIIYILKKNLGNGHTCLPSDKLISVACTLLDTDSGTVDECVAELEADMEIVSDVSDGKKFVFLTEYYNAERHIAARLSAVKTSIPAAFAVSDLEIDRCENKMGIKFDEKQRGAVVAAVENGMLILTGGPGTGKTTTLKAIIDILKHRDLDIVLAAPTGRAAKRMTELTGNEAKTIHRLLECTFGEDSKQVFARNEKNPLECSAIIIDEMSMVDALLFDSLIRALRYDCRIIMVGDADQLPSVGAGNVLSDLLTCGTIPNVQLKTVFRQAGKSKIIRNAHAIIDGEPIDLKNDADSDFFVMNRPDAVSTVNTVIDLVTNRLPAAYGFSSTDDIQVLCPSRKMDTGTVNLNNVLQSVINPPDKNRNELNYKGIYFRTGDKVMQIKNNYDLLWEKSNGETGSGVFNGDIGTVVFADRRAGCLKVKFDDKTVEYISDELSELELAYAVTVHKSQGSEFDCVVMPLFDTPQMLRYRNLLYTGVTRAKKLLVIVGSGRVFMQMAENDRKTLRYTGLARFLKEANA